MDNVWTLIDDMIHAMQQMAAMFDIEHTRGPEIRRFKQRAAALQQAEQQ